MAKAVILVNNKAVILVNNKGVDLMTSLLISATVIGCVLLVEVTITSLVTVADNVEDIRMLMVVEEVMTAVDAVMDAHTLVLVPEAQEEIARVVTVGDTERAVVTTLVSLSSVGSALVVTHADSIMVVPVDTVAVEGVIMVDIMGMVQVVATTLASLLHVGSALEATHADSITSVLEDEATVVAAVTMVLVILTTTLASLSSVVNVIVEIHVASSTYLVPLVQRRLLCALAIGGVERARYSSTPSEMFALLVTLPKMLLLKAKLLLSLSLSVLKAYLASSFPVIGCVPTAKIMSSRARRNVENVRTPVLKALTLS